MNFRYIKNLVPVAALSLSLGLGSCVGDLDVEPIDPSTNMTLDYEALFNKCYANMGVAGNNGKDGDCDIDGLDGGTSGFVRQMWNANELATDEAICCWVTDEGIPQFNFAQWGATHPMVRGFYYRLYFGVTVCNFYLSQAADYDATMTAEVRFLRALYYYHLMDTFGNVPFLTEVSSEPAPQATRAEVYAFIEKELLEIESTLAAPQTNTYGRADKAAAWMLLSRLYLNAEVYTGTAQWAKAAEYAGKIMNSAYKLHTTGAHDAVNNVDWSAYQMLFMADNNNNGAQCEAILPILQDGLRTTSYGTSLFLMGSTFKEDMFIIGENTNNSAAHWGGNRCRPEFVKKFFPNSEPPTVNSWEMVEAAGDDRALLWGVKRTLDIEQVKEFTEGFSVAKFTNYTSTGAATSAASAPDTDFFLMRAAEAWLTFAEATARQNGGVAEGDAADAINEIRARANVSDLKDSYSMNEILDEWAREFYFEGRRRIDLIRHGKFGGSSDYKWQWKGGVKEGTNFASHLNIYALPDWDLSANKNLEQNPGYAN